MSYPPPPGPNYPPPGQPMHPQQPMPQPHGAVGALILACIGLIPFLGPLFSLIGIIVAIVALAKSTTHKKSAFTAIALGLLSMVVVTPLASKLAMDALTSAGTKFIAQARVKAIGHSMLLYTGDSHDEWPPDLDTLVNKGFVKESQLSLTERGEPAGQKRDVFYCPPARDAPPTTLVLCGYRGNYEGGRHVLQKNGAVFWLTDEEFQRRLKQPENAAFAAALARKEDR